MQSNNHFLQSVTEIILKPNWVIIAKLSKTSSKFQKKYNLNWICKTWNNIRLETYTVEQWLTHWKGENL